MAVNVIIQPQASNMKLIGSVSGHRDWDSNILACFTDCKSLLSTWFCLSCTLCDLSSRVGDCIFMPWCVPGGLITMRTRIRTLGGIKGSICNDCIAMSCCGICGVCQMQRELDAMGL